MPHINYKYDYTVEVFIIHEDKVFLRKHDKYNTWLSVGGHIDLDEDPIEAIHKEVKEETGLEVVLYDNNRLYKEDTDSFKELIPPFSMNKHKINEFHWHITMVYYGFSNNTEIHPEYQDDLSNEFGWFTKEEVEGLTEIKDNVRFYALKAFELIG